MTTEEKNENPRDRATRFKFAIRQISIYYEMGGFSPTGEQKLRRVTSATPRLGAENCFE